MYRSSVPSPNNARTDFEIRQAVFKTFGYRAIHLFLMLSLHSWWHGVTQKKSTRTNSTQKGFRQPFCIEAPWSFRPRRIRLKWMKLQTVLEHFSSAWIAFQVLVCSAPCKWVFISTPARAWGIPSSADIQPTHCAVNVWSGPVWKQQSTLKTNDPSALQPGDSRGYEAQTCSLNLKTWELLCRSLSAAAEDKRRVGA